MTSTLIENFAVAADGGRLSYYTTGSPSGGPSLLILHGPMSYALSHKDLAEALGSHFTVHTASRRGRGHSDGYPESVRSQFATTTKAQLTVGGKTFAQTYSPYFTAAVADCEVSDLVVLLEATQAEILLAPSSGAVVVLLALLRHAEAPSPAVARLRRIVLYEPPALFTDQPPTLDLAHLARFEGELSPSGEMTADSFLTAAQVLQFLPEWVPRWLLRGLVTLGMSCHEKEQGKRRQRDGRDDGVCDVRSLGALLRYEFALCVEAVRASAEWSGIGKIDGAKLLFVSGGKTPDWIRRGSDVFAGAVPESRKLTVEGASCEILLNVAEAKGQPGRMVNVVREFAGV